VAPAQRLSRLHSGSSACGQEGQENSLPFGPEPEGFLIYTPERFVSAQLMKPRRLLFQGHDWQGGTADEYQQAGSGLAGRYDFGLIYRPDQPLAGDRGDNSPAPSDQDALQDIYGAVQQQLGLRLEATKTPVDVIVVDHLEKPSEN
jgi:hypothetical protein